MSTNEPTVCADCAAEPDDAAKTQTDLENEGWDFTGEFGARCPGCLGNVLPAAGDGIAGVAAAAGAPEAPPKPKLKRAPRKPKLTEAK